MANRKISELGALTAPAADDLLAVVDVSEGANANKNKKITYGELFKSVIDGTETAPAIAFDTAGTTGLYKSAANELSIATNGGQAIKVEANNKTTIFGDLVVTGGTTTVSSTTITVADKNIELGTGNTSDAGATGGGLTLKAATDKTWNWIDSTDSWTSNQNIDLVSGMSYKIQANQVLTATTLGSGVVNSSLTSVGTLGSLAVTNAITAGSLDISGGADIDGTLEADAYTVNGVALNEFIADTVGAMVSSNTETNITVTYQDSDNTLDFVIGTLNQDTTGNAATATALQTARNIGGVSFNGTADINLPGVNTGGNQNTTGSAATLTTARTIGGVSFDGSANINLPGVNAAGNQNTSGTAAGLSGTPSITVADVVAASLDISGNADIDGTLEADAYTVNGVALNEFIADTVGAMVSSNTETNITVTYQDSDNTLDFVIGTLNQDTTGNAATATALQTARTIGGVSFDGTANINLPGVNTAGNQNTSGTAANLSGTPSITVADVVAASLDISGNVDIDGTLETDALTINGTSLAETISDTVGAMVTSNTETGISVTYDDADNTLDFVVGTLNQDTTGNAATATALQTARTIGGTSFDGTANITPANATNAVNLTGTIASGVTGTTQATTDNSTKIATTAYVTTAVANLIDSAPGALDTLNELAAAIGDDANFSTTITNSLATKLPLAGGTMTGAINLGSNNITNGGTITGTFVGNITGNVTGNTSGSSGSCTGNAATATALATARTIGGVSFDGTSNINLPGVNAIGNQNTTGSAATLTTARTIGGVSFNGSANINLPGVNTAGNQNTSGNAATATALATARAINGVNFDGTAAITVTAAAGTLTGNTLASGVTASSLTSVGTLTGLTVSGDILMTGTGAIDVPSGTTAQRPGSPTTGHFRYNTTDAQFEGFTASGWGAIAGGGGGASNFTYLSLRNAANNGSAVFDGSQNEFTLVTSGTTTAISPSAANVLLTSLGGVIQQPNEGTSTSGITGFCIDGSTIKFGANLTMAPDFIIHQVGAGIGTPSDNTVNLAHLVHKAQGDILFYGASGAPSVLNAGTSGKFLRTNGSSANPTWETIDLTSLSASNLTSGTVPDARFPATLPAASGANLTALNASNISSGTLGAARIANDAIGPQHIADNAINASSMFSGAVVAEGNIINGAVTSSKLVSTITLPANATATTQSAGNNSTKIATTAYADTAVSNLVDSAPGALNTLNELAAALGDDANFSTTVTNSIATKAVLTGSTNNQITTVTGSNAIQGESNLTFDGSTLLITGVAKLAAGNQLMLDNGFNNRVAEIVNAGSSGNSNILFKTNGSERLRIHSHGQLELKVPDANAALKITPSGTNAPATIDFNTPGTGSALLKVQGSERLRIKNDGRVLIGQTSTQVPGLGNTTVGIGLEPDNGAFFGSRADGGQIINVNNNASSNAPIKWHVSGTLIGQLATSSGEFGLETSGSKNIYFSTSGSERLRISSTGQLKHSYLTSTTPPSYNNGNHEGLMIRTTRDDSNNFLGTVDFAAGRASDGTNGGTQFRFFTQPRSTGHSAERLRITSDGHLLHGFTSDEDTSGNGGVRFINAGDIQIDGDQKALVFRSTNSTAQVQSGIEWWNENGAGVQAKILCDRTAVTKAPSDIVFYTNDDVDTGANNSEGDITERLRIASDGKLGIGTSSPARLLTIHGDSGIALQNSTTGTGTSNGTHIWVSGNDLLLQNREASGVTKFFTSDTERMRLDADGNTLIGATSYGGGGSNPRLYVVGTSGRQVKIHNTNDDTACLQLTNSGTGQGDDNGAKIAMLSDSSLWISNDEPAEVKIATNGSERIRITEGGKVRINRTTQINSDAHLSLLGNFGSSGCGFEIQHQGNSGGNRDFIRFYNKHGSEAGSIEHSGSTSVSFNTSSDYRLKENIALITDGIAKLKLLKPSRFTWKDDPEKGFFDGFIAHEVTPACPNAVSGEKDAERMQSVDYSKLTPLLTAALQQAISKIEVLELKVASLESA